MNKRNHFNYSNPKAELLAIALVGLCLLGPAHAENSSASRPDEHVSDGISSSVEGANELSAMLPFLITSSDRKHLAAELLTSIEKGDLKGAEDKLNAAIEAGTLAIALIDRLHDPDLLATLQALGLQGAQSSSASPNSCSAPALPIANLPIANLAQLQEALDEERTYNSMVSRTLTDLMEQNNALTARLETDASASMLKISELESALQEEQRQRETVSREFASLQADYRTLQAAEKSKPVSMASNTQATETLLQQERERRDNVERQLAVTREELRNLQAAKDRELKNKESTSASQMAELKEVLRQSQARGDDLAQKLADATETLHSLQQVQEQTQASPMLGSAPMGGKALSAFMVAPAAPAVPPLPPEASIVFEESRPASRATPSAPSERTALVEVAQLPKDVHPLSVSGISPPARSEPSPTPQPDTVSPPQDVKPDERLTIRADELFRKGDVSGARLLLEHSVKNGNARAAFLLAETYDPHVLAKLGVMGIRGDADKARELYAQAQARGMPQASERMQALK